MLSSPECHSTVTALPTAARPALSRPRRRSAVSGRSLSAVVQGLWARQTGGRSASVSKACPLPAVVPAACSRLPDSTATPLWRQKEATPWWPVCPATGLYGCPEEGCNKRFRCVANGIRHLRTHNGQKPWPCSWEGCNKQFSRRHNMRAHLASHTGEKAAVCPLPGCGRRFANPVYLRLHIQRHSANKPFVCPYEGCSKSFSMAAGRYHHLRTHSGIKPFVCSFDGCGKSFSTPKACRIHQAYHSEDKAYSCPYPACTRLFAYRSNRSRHLGRHTPGRQRLSRLVPADREELAVALCHPVRPGR